MSAPVSPPPSATGVDLHTHSTASDGLLTPAELVHEASRRGISVLAVTDHDTLDGLAPARNAAASLGIEFIPGVELSTEFDGHEVHVLGYYVDPEDAALREALARLAGQRAARTERIVGRLTELGLPVSYARVVELAAGGTIGRPHIARAMIEAGYATSVSDAFDRFFAHGKPAFVPREKWLPEQSVDLLRDAGAIPVLAHPFSTGDIAATLERLIPRGLLGIEVYYGEYSTAQHDQLRAIADEWSLIPTGGSDYHGPNFKEGRELGSAPVPVESALRLARRWRSLLGPSS